jgi:two-component system, response regulator PdtaR
MTIVPLGDTGGNASVSLSLREAHWARGSTKGASTARFGPSSPERNHSSQRWYLQSELPSFYGGLTGLTRRARRPCQQVSCAGFADVCEGTRMIGPKVELPGQNVKAHCVILLVEDEVLVRMMIADRLRNAGLTVVEAANADEALDVLAHNGDVKVMLTDVQMPGSMNGVELSRAVRFAHPTLKVLLTSGNDGMLRGVEHDGFFPKPFDVGQIVKRIAALLD